MAMLWVQKIMSTTPLEAARAVYRRVPRLLRANVRKILIDAGVEEMIDDGE